jgi:hypothetical protein
VSDTRLVSFRYRGTAWPRECFAWIASASADTVHTAGSDEEEARDLDAVSLPLWA